MRFHLVRYKSHHARRVELAVLTPYRGPDGRRWAIPWYIVACESGGGFRKYNARYEPSGPGSGPGGAYQIIRSTWRANGGHGDARYAPALEQHRVASRLWHRLGGQPWDCA
jgi:transglycosylase-like protein